MAKMRVPASWVTGKDKLFLLTVTAIAGLSGWLVPDFFTHRSEGLNGGLVGIIGPHLAVFMLMMLPALFWALHLRSRMQALDDCKKAVYVQKRRDWGRIYFRIECVEGPRGLDWGLRNTSPFPWTNAKVFVECLVNGQRETDVIFLGAVKPGEQIVFQTEAARNASGWRVLVLTEEGYYIDLPTWNNQDIEDRCAWTAKKQTHSRMDEEI